VQLRASTPLVEAAASMARAAEVPQLRQLAEGLVLDPDYTPTPVPQPRPASPSGDPLSLAQPLVFSTEPEQSTYVVRGEIPDGDAASRVALLLTRNAQVAGVFSDPVIEPCITCGGTAAVGASADVQDRLDVPYLASGGLTGVNVPVAVVDTGINLGYLQGKGLQGKGLTVATDPAHSWTPSGVATQPFQHPIDHGTMCAYDLLLAAPQATLLDVAVLLSEGSLMSGLLSDAVQAYAALRSYLVSMPEADRRLVITNSWGMYSPAWDFPPGHPGNYSDNPAHPFNVIVSSLEAAGADVLFAAGNCGRDCPAARCKFVTRPICGANSHPKVLCIGGVDVEQRRVGYSSQGPGRLATRKPDVCAYTHFDGSGVFAPDPDSGTSASCPLATGVIAAVRTKHGINDFSPGDLRATVRRTAIDEGGHGFDYDYGYGIIDPKAIVGKISHEEAVVSAAAIPEQQAAKPPVTAS
jgi:subtilisin family serine protease